MGFNRFKPMLDRAFLRGELAYEFEDWKADGHDAALLGRLRGWSARELTRETQTEAAFVQRFFIETWGYRDDGAGADAYNLFPKFPIAGAGQGDNRGEADLAVGLFGGDRPAVPQIVCEFKDIRSGLDDRQYRKGNNRSPVQQAQDYLYNARRGIAPAATLQPRFALVTDMNEFRLYWAESMPERYLRFKIGASRGQLELGDTAPPLTDEGEDALFDRFLFWRLFRADMLLSDAGRTRLERLIERQGKAEKKLEGDFYADYRAYREVLIGNISLQRPDGMTRSGTVRLGQKLLDRLIFLMFAEDMGGRVGFPHNALQDELIRQSRDQFLEPEGDEVWARLRRIFATMNEGGRLGTAAIHRFNGGLFATDPDIDGLSLPNRLFVRFGQAQNEAKFAEHKDTLLYLAATYNFAKEGDAKNSIGLYTLGHIFEQSIVDLEKLEAQAEGRPSIHGEDKVGKRKRDGVYYTPEWVVRKIVEETVDPLFARWKTEAGWVDGELPSPDTARAYWDRIRRIKVIDPSCGSGAFLIVALDHLHREFEMAAEYAVATRALTNRPDAAAITEGILVDNLYGVDINPASVEITRLSLWLHTARANRPLSALDAHIQCGNSLVDRRFYNKRTLDDAEERDRVNTFEWDGDFAVGSFDAVIGNPPYVKLQNFVKVHADIAAWLVAGSSGEAPYTSTTTSNFDLYLPFIEKGLTLLNDCGRMGYIAPSLWPTLGYGEGLRRVVHAGRHLEKWLDFRSFQIFEDATTYTAIQIFTKAPAEAIRLAFAGDGDISRANWTDDAHAVPYEDIASPLSPWLLAPRPVRTMIERLGREGTPLGDATNTNGIIVGIQTSADHIFHLRRLGRNRYVYVPRRDGKKLAEVEVQIEDALMKPLISGAEAKRFLEPRTDTYLLFPYDVAPGATTLLAAGELAARFPMAWAYLSGFERELRDREGRKFDDDRWYRMGRTQNLDKQEVPKLLVPRLVTTLGCFADDEGRYYCDNVDVGGVVPARLTDLWFIAGILNAPATDAIFAWLSKPFRGGYKSANKQFIAPLPIPRADPASRAALSALARQLQTQRTSRIDLLAGLAERLARTARTIWPLERILPGVRPLVDIEAEVPRSVPPSQRKGWADERREAEAEAALARLDGLILPGSELAVKLAAGKLTLTVDEIEAASAFVAEGEAALVAAQWRCVALDFTPSGKGDAWRLTDWLRRVATAAPPEIADAVLTIGDELATLTATLAEAEARLHAIVCRLFALTPDERALVERGRP